jgi:hypothetical protein
MDAPATPSSSAGSTCTHEADLVDGQCTDHADADADHVVDASILIDKVAAVWIASLCLLLLILATLSYKAWEAYQRRQRQPARAEFTLSRSIRMDNSLIDPPVWSMDDISTRPFL